MKQLYLFLLMLSAYAVVGQTYNMSNSNVTTCSGTFYDSGGSGSGYQSGENYTKTFCPTTPGAKVILNFTSFDTENTYEHLYIYDGNSTAAPLVGNYTGSAGPGLVQASAGNTSGCLTIRFTSDGSVQYTGWVAAISCYNPCQSITSVLNSSSPAVGAGSIIRACVGQPVTFNGSGNFSVSGAGASYTWNFGNGTSGSGATAVATYTAPGSYFVNLNILVAGCGNTNNLNQIVQIGTIPTSSSNVADPTVCLGQSTTITGSFTPTPFIVNCTPPVSGTTFLPDGSGVSYATSINVDCFNAGQTLTAANQLQDICLNMEHSYQGDLSIQIVCPNGQICNLKDYPGGAYNYLGAPLDDPTVGPGVGANYCFSMSGSVLLCNGPTTANQGNPAYTSITAGTYLPTGNFSSLVGCPLNGPWTIRVTDNLFSDNGYIFNWDLNFAPGLAPAAGNSFTPTIVSQTWSGPNITTNSGNNITVTPTSTGTQCYTLTAVDNFGCSHTRTQCMNVINGPFAGVSNTLAVCSSAVATNLFSLLGPGVSTTGTWSGPAPALTGGNLGTFNPAAYTAGTYSYTYTVPGSGGCPASSAVIAATIRPNPAATLTFTNPSCGNNNGIIVINNTSPGGQTITSFASSGGTVSGQTVTGLGAGTHVITLTNNFGCTFTVSATLSNSPPITDVVLTPNNIICGAGTGSITIGAVTGGTAPYTYAVNGGAFSASPPVTGLTSATYSITVRDANGCLFTKTVAITVTPGPTAIAGNVAPAACSQNNGSYSVTGVTGGTPAYSFSVDAVSTGSVTGSLASGTHTVTVRDANGCTYSTTFNIANLTGPTAANVSTVSASCGSANGSATVTSVAGGTTPYQYSFNGGGFSTTNNVGGLTSGPKNVVVRDANNCTYTLNFTISSLGSPTTSIASTTSVTCNGGATGSINLNTSGGTPAYTYTILPTNATNGIGMFAGLTAQTYTINVRDAAGCTASITQVISQPTALTLTLAPSAVNCNGGNTGSITATSGNGTGTHQYSLNGGAFQASGSFTGLTAGTYTITVRDANNCTFNQTAVVTQPTPLALTFNTSPNSCLGATGATTIGVTGGVPAYSFSVNAVASANPATGLGTGPHTATVRDANGCIINGTFNIGILPGPSAATVTTTNASCGSSNGSATVTAVTGGATPYQYSFNGGAFGAGTTVGSLTAGAQTLTVRDANSCTLTVNFNVNNAGSPSATVTSVANVGCNGASTGSLAVGASGGTPGYSYTLTPGGTVNTTGLFTGLNAQPYSIAVRDALGCIVTVTTTLTQPAALTLALNPFNVSCNAGTNGSVTAVAANGSGTYQYSLNGGAFQASGSFTGLTSGTYTVTVRDANNCTLTQVTTITQPTALTRTFTTTPNSCAGSVGSVAITAGGGTPAYTYSVDGISSGSTVSPLTTGNHSLTVRDAQGCVVTGTFAVNAITGPSAATVVTANAACGSATGASTVTGVTGGTGPYQYSFDGAAFATGTVRTGLSSGSHTVVVLDANTCTLSVLYNIANNGSPTISLTSSANALCNGASTGSFVVTATGGSGAPFTYTLTSPYQTNGNGQFTNLPFGIYSVNAKDVAGCLTSMTVSVGQPSALSLSPTSVPVKCFGTSTGTVNVTGAGGITPYQFQINGTGYQSSGSFTTVPSNTHIINIRDANGCTATQTVAVTQPAALALNISTQNANCTSANGVASSTVTGGTSPYNYAWTGGGGTNPITGGLASGTYSLTVTDANGCVINGSAVIGNTPGGTAAITGSTNITCNNAGNGSLTANMVTAGTAPYSYSWTPGGQTNSTATNLGPGTYTCIITDLHGCIATAIGILIQPSPLTAIMNSNNVKCYGTATGTVSAAGTGGTNPYTYLWTTLASTLTTVNNVAIGNYTCQITDANNCVINPTIAVTQPSSVTLSASVTPANCNQSNGSATVTASGGTPAYTYTWTSGSNSPIQNSLPAATYTINVKDANNCTYTVAATIPNLSGPTISITSSTNVSCFGGNNGIAISQGNGGTGTLTYTWSGGQITPTATGLLAGVHTVTVTDQTGCIASTNVTITQPTVLTVSVTPGNPKCFGALNGYGAATAFGGTPIYTYNWTGGGGAGSTSTPLGAGSYSVNVTDSKGCTVTAGMVLVNPPAMVASITSTNVSCFNTCNGAAAATTTNNIGIVTYHWIGGPSPVTAQTVNGLCAGVYTVTATDQNTCTASAQVIITQPTQVSAMISSSSSVTCNGGSNGSAQVTPAGGTGAYTYTWTGAAAGSSGNANNLPAGNYTVTVGDANGCTASTQVTILQPAPLATTLTTTNPTCNGLANGTGNLAFTGGAGLPDIRWFPGLQSGNTVNNLTVGAHTVTITYNLTCPASLTFTLTQPALLTAVVSATNSNCGQSNGAATATVSGGTGTTSYLWSNGVTGLNNPAILAGPHSFTVTDANNCKAYATALVNDIAGPTVVVTSTTAVRCFNGTDGAATTSITGGVAPYTISWTNHPATTQNVTTFPAGPHNITVIDDAGCVGTANATIGQPTQLVTAITSFSNVTCFGLTNGQATMMVNGGTAGYTYSWTPTGQTSSVMTNVAAATYTCYVSDANNCASSQVVTIAQPQALIMAASSFTNISCFGGSNGQISTSFQGGTPGYTYSWLPAQTNSGVLTGLPLGAYALTVTDANNCAVNANFNIQQPPLLSSTYTSTPAKCNLLNGSATVNVFGGTPSYTLNWNAGAQQGPTATNMGPGSNWTCTITDSKGCMITQTVSIADAPGPMITSLAPIGTACHNTLDGSIILNYVSGTPGYTVSWSGPSNPAAQLTAGLSQTVTSLSPGTYSVIVTDTYGCTTDGVAIVSSPPMLGWMPVQPQSICYGQSAQLSVNGVGGTMPYTYTWSPAFTNTGGPHTTPSLTTTTQYNVNMVDAHNCVVSPIVVTVNVSPPLTVISHSTSVCDGLSAVLTPTITSPGRGMQYITYEWLPGGQTSSTLFAQGNFATAPHHYTVIVRDGCTDPRGTAVFTVAVNPNPTGTVTASTPTLCAPGAVSFSVSPAGTNTFVWYYNGKDVIGSGSTISYTAPKADTIRVKVTITNEFQCTAEAHLPAYVVAYDRPVAGFVANPQTTSIIDPLITFANTSTGANAYVWSFGDGHAINGTNFSGLLNPNHMYNYVGVYTVNLVVTSVHGCVDETSRVVEITPDFALYIPNTFTPDGNGMNDLFQPSGIGINEDKYKMEIFDRWGESIFTSNNFSKGWDGSVKGSGLAQQGVYIYKLMVYDLQGNEHPYVGHITVLRAN